MIKGKISAAADQEKEKHYEGEENISAPTPPDAQGGEDEWRRQCGFI